MNRNKLFILILALVTTLSFTSCLSDDYEDKQISQAELKAAFLTIQGNYQGWLFSHTSDGKSGKIEKKDSLRTTWEIRSDSTVLVRNFPSKMLANNITNLELKKAVEALPARDIKCAFNIYSVNPILFDVAPFQVELGKLTYGGETHKVAIGFAFRRNLTFGGFYAPKKQVGIRLIEGGVIIDDKVQSEFYKGLDYFYLLSDAK